MDSSVEKPHSSRRILVVDDNRDAAKTLSMLLKISGNETYTAHDGEEAIEKASVIRPDAIILDIGLPKASGYDVCRFIRAQPWGRHIAMVALTGWGQEEDRHESHEAGFNGHLVKPVDYQDLVQLLVKLQNERLEPL